MRCVCHLINSSLSFVVFFLWFCYFTSQVKSYGHGGGGGGGGGSVHLTTLFLGKLEQVANQYFLFARNFVIDNNPC